MDSGVAFNVPVPAGQPVSVDVVAYNGFGESEPAAWTGTVPERPVLTSPLEPDPTYGGAFFSLEFSTTINLEWEDAGADTYRVVVRDAIDPSTPVMDESTSQTQYTTPILPAGQYTWSVFALHPSIVGEVPNAPVVVANAGPDQTVTADSEVTLDGSSSFPAINAGEFGATYQWQLTAPAGSNSSLTGAALATPQFIPDVAGVYDATLTVADGGWSAVDTVQITVDAPTPVLSEIRLDGFAIPDFSPEINNYVIEVPDNDSSGLLGYSLPMDSTATVTGPSGTENFLYGLNTFQWFLDDGGVTNSYTLTVRRPAPLATVTAPSDGATSVEVDPNFFLLDWSDVAEADSYNVYLAEGANELVPLVNNTGLSSVGYSLIETDFGPLVTNTSYRWRVDTVVGSVVNTGVEWTFTVSTVLQ